MRSLSTAASWVAAVALLICHAVFATDAAAATPKSAKATVLPGIDVLESLDFAPLRGKRVGVLTNPTGVTRAGEPTWRRLARAPGVKVVALFGAEHGFDGRARAGVEVPNAIEPSTRLPIYSLYGQGPLRRPTPRMLEGIDVMVYDIQDTGCRSYTYISTLGLMLDACGAAGVAVMVLDRPNPLGGTRVEGARLDPRFKSFVGQWPIPYAYGLTAGELARMIQGERWITNRCALTVVPMRGWTRSMTWNDTGLRWVASSPNVPYGNSPLYLVATGMLGEIGGVNLGTGSPLSFQIIGAPYLDPRRLAAALNAQKLSGVTFHPFAQDMNRSEADGQEVRGVRLEFTRPDTAPLVAINLYALEAIKKTSGRDLFRQAVSRGKSWTMFDKVAGSDSLRRQLQAGRSAKDIVRSWRTDEVAFRERRQPYLLYP
ncbi:MAG: DUF1343 domain-containing protein [Verrucomicrobiales bacterium]|nr:DUF1343 domain-containing protein [Verrucomicrobiales bacterium]